MEEGEDDPRHLEFDDDEQPDSPLPQDEAQADNVDQPLVPPQPQNQALALLWETLDLNGRLPVFLPIPHDDTDRPILQKRLNIAAVHDDYDKEKWYPFPSEDIEDAVILRDSRYHVRVVNAAFHENRFLRGSVLERKLVVGTVLGYKKPTMTGSVNGMTVTSRNPAAQLGSNKRIKSGVHSLSSNSRLLMLADAFPDSTIVMCLIISGPNSLYNSCGQTSLATEVRVGDLIGVYEPALVTRRLGDNIPIFDDWNRLVLFKRNLTLPEKPILMSSVANQQVHFYKHGVTLAFSNAQLLTGMKVPCVGTTCDRQTSSCVGCHMGSAIRRNVVLKVIVEIENQSQYDSSTGIAAFSFRSYALTELFLDLQSLSNMDFELMRSHELAIRRAIQRVQDLVNGNGGWTVVGWHRRGVVTALEDGSFELNSNTAGHLIKVEPTDLTPPFLQQVTSLQYRMSS